MFKWCSVLTKNLGVAISDEVDEMLNAVIDKYKFKNRADAIEFLIKQGFKQVEAKA
jgi:metal-responsive CopG/Arc/MetJ family transcriptional regulator